MSKKYTEKLLSAAPRRLGLWKPKNPPIKVETPTNNQSADTSFTESPSYSPLETTKSQITTKPKSNNVSKSLFTPCRRIGLALPRKCAQFQSEEQSKVVKNNETSVEKTSENISINQVGQNQLKSSDIVNIKNETKETIKNKKSDIIEKKDIHLEEKKLKTNKRKKAMPNQDKNSTEIESNKRKKKDKDFKEQAISITNSKINLQRSNSIESLNADIKNNLNKNFDEDFQASPSNKTQKEFRVINLSKTKISITNINQETSKTANEDKQIKPNQLEKKNTQLKLPKIQSCETNKNLSRNLKVSNEKVKKPSIDKIPYVVLENISNKEKVNVQNISNKNIKVKKSLSLKKNLTTFSQDSIDISIEALSQISNAGYEDINNEAFEKLYTAPLSNEYNEQVNEVNEYTEDKLKLLEKSVAEKRVIIDELKRSSIYYKKHNLEELQNQTEVYKTACQCALEELLIKVKESTECDMQSLLVNLNIHPDDVGYSINDEAFL